MLVDGTPLSELDLARLKAKQGPASVVERVAAEWQRPSPNVRKTLGWTALALARELKAWQAALPRSCSNAVEHGGRRRGGHSRHPAADPL